jgi:hemoglobin-like flavoprotein
MSPETERLIRESWASLQPVSDSTVAAFYAHLFESNPELSSLFRETDMVEQRRKFAAMMSEIVRVLDQPLLLVGEVADSGRRHVRYGVSDEDYVAVGRALLWALSEALGEKWTPAVSAAWREAYELLAGVMRRAAAHPSGTRQHS